jgi:hypothetical protein
MISGMRLICWMERLFLFRLSSAASLSSARVMYVLSGFSGAEFGWSSGFAALRLSV